MSAKQRWKRLFAVLAVWGTVLGGISVVRSISPTPKREPAPPEWYEIPAEGVVDKYSPYLNEAKRTFLNFQPIVEAIRQHPRVALYEGLPHPTWEAAAFQQEAKERSTITDHRWPFYASPISMTAVTETSLRELLGDRANYVPYRGMKNCGGYHPDWLLVFEGEGEPVSVQLCLGCCEMKAWHGDRELHCDMWCGTTVFKSLLKRYHKNRPR